MTFRSKASELLWLRHLFAMVCMMSVVLSFANFGHAAGVNNIAPEEDLVVELPFEAKPGDRFVVSWDCSQHQRTKGRDRLVLQQNSVDHGEFLERRPDGYSVRLSTPELLVKIGEHPSPSEAMMAQLLNTFHKLDQDRQTVFATNQTGRPIQIPEWRAINAFRTKVIKEHFPAIVEEVSQKLAAALNKSGRMSSLIEELTTKGNGLTYEDGKAAAAADAEASLALMAAAQNIGLPRIGVFEWKKEAPVLENEDKTKTTTKVWFESFNRQFDVAEIRWRTEFDRADLKNTQAYKDRLDEFLKSETAKEKVRRLPSLKQGETLKFANKHLQLKRTDEGFAKVRISDGWTKEATYEARTTWSTLGAEEVEVSKYRITVKRLPPG
ncbi:MAG: hypothetical protein GY948_16955 [Alphaproteobacteria bacterium]|nr:hypothetical protein [Alphaproteobacteria bacterium]